MYIPKTYEMHDKETIYDLIENNSFAILFSAIGGQSSATHLPLLLDRNEGCLYGHMAKANPHWANIENEVLVVFSGAHAYISPSWFETTHAVPTWNYVAVHVYGNFELIEEKERLLQILDDSVTYYESGRPNAWDMGQVEPHFIDNLSNGIVGFKIQITKMEGKWKLSQNHSKERQERVIHALEVQQDDNSQQIAKLMRENLEKLSN